MKASRRIYLIFAWLFVVGVVVQVFLAGMAVVAGRWPWANHVTFGHLLAAPLLAMLIAMYVGKLPGRMKRLTWLLFAVYVLQADVLIFMRASTPVLSALHPVLALARQATVIVRVGETSVSPQLQPDTVIGD